jgi:hypothetical protein
MATGVSSLSYPQQQPPPKAALAPDDSYWLVRVHDAQAYFAANILSRPAFLAVASTIESSFQSGQVVRSLHQVRTIQRNVPARLGFQTNLTDWLPARRTDWLRLGWKNTVVLSTPFKDVLGQMEKLNLVSQVSAVRPDLAAAVKVSEIVGKLLSFALGEGQERTVLDLTMDLNVGQLQAGYWAVWGSLQDASWPSQVWLDEAQRLQGDGLEQLCYLVIQVIVVPRRESEAARTTGWWELLEGAKEQAESAQYGDEDARRKAYHTFLETLNQAQSLARKDPAFLLVEIREIFARAHADVKTVLFPREEQATGELPEAAQATLGVRTESELQQIIRDYQDAVEVSRQLLAEYELSEP